MHCPKCGSIATTGQQFCRACGLNLDKVAELVGEDLRLQSAQPRDELARLKELQQKHENWGGIAAMATGAVMLILFIILIFTQMILKGGLLILPGSLLILLALGVGVMIYFQASAKSLKEKLEQRPLPNLPPSKSLPAENLLPPGSVTDRTTELLSPSSADTAKIDD